MGEKDLEELKKVWIRYLESYINLVDASLEVCESFREVLPSLDKSKFGRVPTEEEWAEIRFSAECAKNYAKAWIEYIKRAKTIDELIYNPNWADILCTMVHLEMLKREVEGLRGRFKGEGCEREG